MLFRSVLRDRHGIPGLFLLFFDLLRTTFQGALDHFETEEPRGECVIVIEGKSPEEIKKEKEQTWEAMSIMEHMDVYLSQGIEKKEAMKLVAKDRGIGKRDVYQMLLEEQE